MVRRAVAFIIITAVFISVACLSFAQDSCVKPLRPNADSISEGPGIERAGFIYEEYFTATEEYLNCLNGASHRTINDARAAGGDYQRLLDRYGKKIEPVYTLPQGFRGGDISLPDLPRSGSLILGDSRGGQLIGLASDMGQKESQRNRKAR